MVDTLRTFFDRYDGNDETIPSTDKTYGQIVSLLQKFVLQAGLHWSDTVAYAVEVLQQKLNDPPPEAKVAHLNALISVLRTETPKEVQQAA